MRIPYPRTSLVFSTVLYLVVMSILLLMIFTAVFRSDLVSGVVNPGEAFDPGWHMFQRTGMLIMGVVGFIALYHEARQDLWESFGFYPPKQRLRWRFKDFEAVKSLEIGPFTGLENKALVLVLRWKAQRQDLLKASAFTLFIKTPPEPFAKFNLQFFGQNGSEKTLLAQQSIQQIFN